MLLTHTTQFQLSPLWFNPSKPCLGSLHYQLCLPVVPRNHDHRFTLLPMNFNQHPTALTYKCCSAGSHPLANPPSTAFLGQQAQALHHPQAALCRCSLPTEFSPPSAKAHSTLRTRLQSLSCCKLFCCTSHVKLSIYSSVNHTPSTKIKCKIKWRPCTESVGLTGQDVYKVFNRA